ncbi:MAG TPA: ABC transporter substrate-binding protein, partial [bacterium]|nr:ABC transporter substrate-binding protein [bacterium]
MRRWLIILVIIHLMGCVPHTPSDGGITTIALSSDPETLNPLFATGTNSSAVIYFLYPDLVEYDFNETTGRDTILPSLAKSWTISDDHSTLTYHLHTHAHWHDGKKITAQDFAYTYRLY